MLPDSTATGSHDFVDQSNLIEPQHNGSCLSTLDTHSPNSLKKSEKESGLAMASVGVREEEEEEEEEGKVATLLGTREKRLLSLSLVATMESDILFSSGLSWASANN